MNFSQDYKIADMKRRPIIIGNKNFGTKKAAKEYYSSILNSYNFGQSLSEEHYYDLMDLVEYYRNENEDSAEEKQNQTNIIEKDENEVVEPIFVKDIRIARYEFNTRCFELVPSKGEPLIISYRIFIDKPKINDKAIFCKVCRNTIQADLVSVKQEYFKEKAKDGMAPCQESKKYFNYEDLVVDHRQPNTLSVIIDRFIELYNIDVDKIEYKSEPKKLTEFKDTNLAKKFREYHKEKALLRVVEKKLNSSRSGLARLKQMKDDLKIHN